MNNLVIVESPTKARTLQKFLGSDYQIEASMGHIRDLPKGEFGVDIEHDFEPKYIIPRDKKKRVNELKKLAAKAKTLYLATDLDREGEAIAWHIKELIVDRESSIGKKKTDKQRPINDIRRVVFHEITEEAIKEAFANPRQLDLQLVDAQQARRILDRLVGYKLSPLLWQKIKKGLSAGRVQSVALRLIVEREKEVLAFKPQEYWIIEAKLGEDDQFVATLIEQNGLPAGRQGKKLEIKDKKEADFHLKNLENAKYVVSKVIKKEVKRNPYPPFTTSTLQQSAANRLGMSAKKTMMLAQNLYERGLITYMRTDSVNLSNQAITAVRSYIGSSIGKEYLPASPRIFKSKSKNAQEAHEAIRVTDIKIKGEAIGEKDGLNRDHARLYDLIWKRFVSCQMNEALMDQTIVDIKASDYIFRATGSVVKFDGWLKLYGKEAISDAEEVNKSLNEKKQVLPVLEENKSLELIELIPGQHFTEPPPRFNEASLIKKLEELGIGRPSTYAPILSTIQDRFYVEKLEKKFIPTSLGNTVCEFLVTNFSNIVDYSFTAKMEDEFDEISRGERQWRPTIKEFFDPFEKKLESVEKTAEKVKMELELAGKPCPLCSKDLVVRMGKFGKFFACSGFPECKHTEGMEEKIEAKCPEDGGEVVVRRTKRGKTFYGCKNWPNCKYASWTKPKLEPSIVKDGEASAE